MVPTPAPKPPKADGCELVGSEVPSLPPSALPDDNLESALALYGSGSAVGVASLLEMFEVDQLGHMVNAVQPNQTPSLLTSPCPLPPAAPPPAPLAAPLAESEIWASCDFEGGEFVDAESGLDTSLLYHLKEDSPLYPREVLQWRQGSIGIPNPTGDQCYMASAIQLLATTPVP